MVFPAKPDVSAWISKICLTETPGTAAFFSADAMLMCLPLQAVEIVAEDRPQSFAKASLVKSCCFRIFSSFIVYA